MNKIKSLYACLRFFCDISTVRTSTEYSSRLSESCQISLDLVLTFSLATSNLSCSKIVFHIFAVGISLFLLILVFLNSICMVRSTPSIKFCNIYMNLMLSKFAVKQKQHIRFIFVLFYFFIFFLVFRFFTTQTCLRNNLYSLTRT